MADVDDSVDLEVTTVVVVAGWDKVVAETAEVTGFVVDEEPTPITRAEVVVDGVVVVAD